MPPSSAAKRSMPVVMLETLVTSIGTAKPPMLEANGRSSAIDRAATATLAPADASAWANPKPMPGSLP